PLFAPPPEGRTESLPQPSVDAGGRSGRRTPQRRYEKSVAGVALGTRRRVAAVRKRRRPTGKGSRRECRVALPEGTDDALSLLGLSRADRVHEPPAGPNERRHALEQLPLPLSVADEVALVRAPADVGMAGQRSEPGAGRVEENGVEGSAERRPARVRPDE